MARVTVWIFVESTKMTVQEMSDRIGLRPDKSWKIGDRRGKAANTYNTNSWSLESAVETGDDQSLVSEQVSKSLAQQTARLRNHAAAFRSVANGNTAGIYLGISATEAPALEFSASVLTALSELRVDMEIDLMIPDRQDSAKM
jgi:Domain of unknown function (DUF4279)